MLKQRNVVNVRALASCCVWNYNSRNTRSANKNFSHIRILTLSFFGLSIPPTWRRVMTVASLTSLSPHVYLFCVLLLPFRSCDVRGAGT